MNAFECHKWSGRAKPNPITFRGPGWAAFAIPREVYALNRSLNEQGRPTGQLWYSRRFWAFGQVTT